MFIIADVTGKSISAGLIVSTIYAAVITYFDQNQEKFELKDFVNCLNRILLKSTTAEKFATGWFGLYDHSSKTLESVNAGHNVTYVLNSNAELSELKTGGLFLGCFDLEYISESVTLNSGDVVFYFTDGVNEAMDSEQNQFGDDRLEKLIRENLNNSADSILQYLLKDIDKFVGDAEQSDDITCGLIKVL